MKKWILPPVGFFILVVLLALLGPPGASWKSSSTRMRMSPPPHHHNSGFRNPWPDVRTGGFREFLRWRRNRKAAGRPVYQEVVGTLPVQEPDWQAINAPGDSLVVTWLGHSTCLLQTGGLTILTDPVFSERCSPMKFAGPRRLTRIPVEVTELPPVDIVVISHNHYDHLDESAVRALGNQPKWFVPLGLASWFFGRGITNVVELDWWDRAELTTGGEVICVPAKHFSSRTVWDRNKALWCGWVVESGKHTIYFAGDTGYEEHFKQIGEHIGSVDLALVPIGSYQPEWFMLPMHVSPGEAVQAHLDLAAARTIGIHWGTFILSDEPISDPPRVFREAARQVGLTNQEILVLEHGETRRFP